MNKPFQVLTLIAAMGLSGAANAALVSRLSGQAVYDTDLNITWLANANVNGEMTWSQASTWAAGLSVNGVSGWRLPTTLQPDATCGSQYANATYGNQSYGFNCTGSEMGHLYYNEFGGTANGWLLSNPNLNMFQNVQAGTYWSNTVYAPYPLLTWTFAFGGGRQDTSDNTTDYKLALAVHSGDVAAVPLPAAAWLLGSGLLGLIGVARRNAV